jgi:cysteine synthase A
MALENPTAAADPRWARLRELAGLVGHTPLLVIHLRYRGQETKLYAKAEYFNLTGSIKDRMALHILAAGLRSGQLRPGGLVTEATSGNAGIAITAMATALGHPVRIYMPDWMSAERIALMRLYGAQVELVSHAQGGFLGSIARTRELALAQADCFLPSQFDNEANAHAHQHGTAVELMSQLATLGLQPDAFVAGVGTGGTVLGVSRHLRQVCPQAKVYPLEPAESPTLSTGHKVGKHHLLHACFTERRKYLLDVSQEHSVRPDNKDTLIFKRESIGVQQIRSTVQSNNSFSSSWSTLHNQHAALRCANDLILLRLNGGNNVAELSGATT